METKTMDKKEFCEGCKSWEGYCILGQAVIVGLEQLFCGQREERDGTEGSD